jgi:hypothetical protein
MYSYTNDKIQYSYTFIQTPTCFYALIHHLQGALHLKKYLNVFFKYFLNVLVPPADDTLRQRNMLGFM